MRILILAGALSFATPLAALPINSCHQVLAAESVETEAKFLLPDLGKLPAHVIAALENGQDDPTILERGFVLQDYFALTPDNLDLAIELTKQKQISFGTLAEQSAMRQSGVAQEIRLLTKSVKIGGATQLAFQLTVKAAGGVAVRQLETPFVYDHNIFSSLASPVAEVRKLHFKLAHTKGPIEVDVFLNSARSPFFINGEVEFHGASAQASLAAAENYRTDAKVRPDYLGADITDVATALKLKSRDLASGHLPADLDQVFRLPRESNRAIVNKIGAEFATWANSSVVRRVWDRPAVSVVMDDPSVFRPDQTSEMTEYFKENGFVVVDHVSTAHARGRVIRLMDEVAKNLAARRAGFMDLYHDDALAQLREEPSLYTVFGNLFKEPKLWVVFDRLMYWNPSEGDLPLAPHVDQNPVTHPDFFAVQGMLALKDMNENTGTLALSPKSHKQFSIYQRWARPTEGYVEYRGTDDLPFIGIRLRAGQIVIWDSRTTHSRFRGQAADTRYAALVTFTPAVDDEALRQARLSAFHAGVGESNHAAGLRATAHPRFEQSLRQTPENLSALGRKLYGIDSWFTRP